MNEKTNEVQQPNDDGFSMAEWARSKPADYDRSDVFFEQVKPLLDQLREQCIRHNLPYYVVISHTQRENCDTVNSVSHHLPSMAEATQAVLAGIVSNGGNPIQLLAFMSCADERIEAATNPPR